MNYKRIVRELGKRLLFVEEEEGIQRQRKIFGTPVAKKQEGEGVKYEGAKASRESDAGSTPPAFTPPRPGDLTGKTRGSDMSGNRWGDWLPEALPSPFLETPVWYGACSSSGGADRWIP